MKRSSLASVAVANGPLEPARFRQALQAAQHRYLVRFTWADTERFTLPHPDLLRRVQREASERGDRQTVAKAQQLLAEGEP